jgi:hypothetical protein
MSRREEGVSSEDSEELFEIIIQNYEGEGRREERTCDNVILRISKADRNNPHGRSNSTQGQLK